MKDGGSITCLKFYIIFHDCNIGLHQTLLMFVILKKIFEEFKANDFNSEDEKGNALQFQAEVRKPKSKFQDQRRLQCSLLKLLPPLF